MHSTNARGFSIIPLTVHNAIGYSSNNKNIRTHTAPCSTSKNGTPQQAIIHENEGDYAYLNALAVGHTPNSTLSSKGKYF